MQVIELAGGAYQRGFEYGRALQGRIAAHVEDWRAWLAQATGLDAFDYIREMLRTTSYVPAIERHAPELLDEVRGMAEGAGLDRDIALGLQLMDEEWFHRVRAGLNRRIPGKCSSLAVAVPGGPTWIGQNMDLGEYTDGHQVVLRVAPGEREIGALVFTTAGVIALMGVNAAGVGVCVNSLPQLPSAPAGVPVAFAIRRLLQAESVDEAARLVQAMPHATNQHYLIAGPSQIRSFEASAAGVAEYRPADPRRVFHTNHPLAENKGQPERPEERRNSAQRLASLVGRLSDGAWPDLAALQTALSASDDPDNPVCRTGGGGNIGFTCGAMISALPEGDGPIRSWVSPGPPSTRGFSALTLDGRALSPAP